MGLWLVQPAREQLASQQRNELAQRTTLRRKPLGPGPDRQPIRWSRSQVLRGRWRNTMVEPRCVCGASFRHWQSCSQQILWSWLRGRGPVSYQEHTDYRAGQDPTPRGYVKTLQQD